MRYRVKVKEIVNYNHEVVLDFTVNKINEVSGFIKMALKNLGYTEADHHETALLEYTPIDVSDRAGEY